MLATLLKVDLINAEASFQANHLTAHQAIGAAYHSARCASQTASPKLDVGDTVEKVKKAADKLTSFEDGKTADETALESQEKEHREDVLGDAGEPDQTDRE